MVETYYDVNEHVRIRARATERTRNKKHWNKMHALAFFAGCVFYGLIAGMIVALVKYGNPQNPQYCNDTECENICINWSNITLNANISCDASRCEDVDRDC